MRWPVKPDDGWRLRFAWLPRRMPRTGNVIWLQFYWLRFMGDCFEVEEHERDIPGEPE